MQVVLDLREKELEERQMELAKILTALNSQQEKLKSIIFTQKTNNEAMELLYNAEELDIGQIEGHRAFGIKLVTDAQNQQRIIDNTTILLQRKQLDVQNAYKKVEVLKKLKEKQEKEYYNEIFKTEGKEIDDITSARFRFN